MPKSSRAHALSPLCGRLLHMQDEACRRLARSLHDTTGQNMAALQMNVTLLAGSSRALDARSRQALSDSVALAQSCMREIRALSYALYPPQLDEAGLAGALRIFAADYFKQTGVQLELDLPADMDRLAPEFEITLFRVVQEGLAHLGRPRGASTLVRMKRGPHSMVLELIERGRTRRQPPPVRPGSWMACVHDRVRVLNGRLTVGSGPGGAAVRARLPLEPANETAPPRRSKASRARVG
jgi:two-component system, NarL family, sensor kinase